MDINKPTDAYTISQLAEEFSVTLRSIRFYEDQGLLTPKRQGKSRIFSRHDRARLILILRGKRLGFSLQEIHELFKLYDSGAQSHSQVQHMLQTIQLRQQKLKQQQADINLLMMELNAAERKCYQHLKKFD
ncbi:MerR family DNA-binding transcriptional regulator [Photobacterium rosenbergii]|uniref:MerR family DNA-binding transcriptional regulator n=1 Tax=Photobacterium rosenbergii TaxID=294936 RepID=A0ABU3ZK34_9GAMM|nr:MerR family DNA-binding transcriptional regulator [Photobacterium rosenbergii]MDV5170474.1 MerR family DNA-binding transcriptional regulator [Photobacterium rosenbergii]